MSAWTWQELAATVLMATGAWTWIMVLCAGLLLGIGSIGVRLEARRKRRIVAAYMDQEDRRRERAAARREHMAAADALIAEVLGERAA